MKQISLRVLAVTSCLVLASALQAAAIKEALLSVKGMVCPA